MNKEERTEKTPCMYCKKEAYTALYYFDKESKTRKVNFTICKEHYDKAKKNGMLDYVILNEDWMLNLKCNKDVGSPQ
jgi:hypothetical protein